MVSYSSRRARAGNKGRSNKSGYASVSGQMAKPLAGPCKQCLKPIMKAKLILNVNATMVGRNTKKATKRAVLKVNEEVHAERQ